MKSWEIHIEGQVQGVGFRPFVYRLAQAEGLCGCVSNGVDGVRISLNATDEQQQSFVKKIKHEAPVAALITSINYCQVEDVSFLDFSIIESESSGKADLLLTPDLSICDACRSELVGQGRRAGYAFTTCTNCGPRYSIINALPYDRLRTEMAPFTMCATCSGEYVSADDRRFFSQTNSCPDCGVKLSVAEDDTERSQQEILEAICNAWRAGKIVGLKGIGGYLITCDANNNSAIERLRLRKQRPDKPLAVMFGGTNEVARCFAVSKEEVRLLESGSAPIVLLANQAVKAQQCIAVNAIAPGLDRIGVMLPYAPLFELLLNAFGGPIVATSGNLSGEPIAYRDTDAVAELSSIADLIITNNREIQLPQDDSVIAVPRNQRPFFMRRSRGNAPTYVHANSVLLKADMLAVGADLKASFALRHGGNTYLSQYLGDLGSYRSQQNYSLTLNHLQNLLRAKPERVLADLHPNYAASQLAETYAQERELPLHRIQHHEAHFSAVLLENEQLRISGNPILGVIWDGTGYGHDGQMWGGEGFVFLKGTFTRVSQLAYYPHFTGDKLAKEPRLSALAIAGELNSAQAMLKKKFTAVEYRIYQQVRGNSKLSSSSMGRLFDAVASLLGCCDRQSYEGMAASRLEVIARRGLSEALKLGGYPIRLDQSGQLPGQEIIKALLFDEASSDIRAARFHLTLVALVEQLAVRHKTEIIAFSGGVFQNVLLVELLTDLLGKIYHLCFHHSVSPNDECIALGQLAHYTISQRVKTNKKEQHVFSYSG